VLTLLSAYNYGGGSGANYYWLIAGIVAVVLIATAGWLLTRIRRRSGRRTRHQSP
jgi:ABC-type phosphate transport system auxiliary subunit